MKRSLARLLCLTTLLVPIAPSMAQASYPNRVVQLMVPYPAGGPSDVTARALSGLIGKEIGGQVIVENLGGASGALGANKVLGSPADGYYLFQGSPNELILSGLANKGVRYKPEDFEFVGAVATSPIVLAVSARMPVKNVAEFVAYAKAGSHTLNFGSVGTGSLVHLLGELFSKRIGVAMTHIPYKGGTPLLTDLVGGQIDFAFLPYQSTYADFVAGGKMKILATLSERPLPTPLQAVPAITAQKELKDFTYGIWTAYFVKSGTAPQIVSNLNNAITATLKNPEVKSILAAQGKSIFEPMKVEAGKSFYAAEIKRYRDLVKTIGFQPE